MRIIVFQGDENRAKIETEFSEDMFFAEVYADAEDMVREIVCEVKRQEKKQDSIECSNNSFQRTPNNIIAFCAQRGQGKTTAMKSFARLLVEGQKDKEDSSVTDDKFIVLVSIDPAALDGGESIVRVVLSRLFYKLEKKYENDEEVQQRERILDLFQKCYRGIDYINGTRRDNQIVDDLEELATLGSSSRLKKNLKELIDLFLGACLPQKGKYEGKGFLVIPIDDVDTCVADIYRCCEEIRNYLVLPNVIILMAADHTQLAHVMYQRYLGTNKELLTYETENAKEECSRLAAGYLLKLIPVNHIIELPELDKMTEQEWDSLTLEYYADEDNRSQSILSGCTKEGTNIRKQLGKLIYDQTGIVIHREDDSSDDCLPNTMRELTQFLKKFGQRPAIDWDVLYGEDLEKAKIEADKLKNNIRVFKSYFLESWAMSHMSHQEYTDFKKNVDRIESKKKTGKIGWTYKELLIYLINTEGQVTEKTKFKDTLDVNNEFCMFMTIFLNEWFSEALRESLENKEPNTRKLYNKIANFLGMEAETPDISLWDATSGKYMLYSFSVPEDICPKFLTQKERYFFYKEKEQIVFDVLRPWDYIVRKGMAYYAHWKAEKSGESEEEKSNVEISKENRDIWLTAQRIIPNVSVCLKVLREIIISEQTTFQKLGKTDWVNEILGNYKALEPKNDGLEYLEITYSGMKELMEQLSDELHVTDSVFLLNKYNMQTFYVEYRKTYKWLFEKGDLEEERKNADIIVNNILEPELPLDPTRINDQKDSIKKAELEKNEILKIIVDSSEILAKLKIQVSEELEKDKTTDWWGEISELLQGARNEFKKVDIAQPSTEKEKKPANKKSSSSKQDE